MDEASTVRTERAGALLRVLIDRPDYRNAIDVPTMELLQGALVDASTDEELRAILLGSTGPNFCSGIDLVSSNPPKDPDAPRPRIGNLHRRIEARPHKLLRVLHDLELPVVTAVRGWAAAYGLALALAGDYVVAGESAKFWTPFTQRGFTPDSGTTWLLPRLIGLGRAKEMLMLGRVIDADRAERWGLVNEVVPDDDVDATAEKVAAEFAASATVSVGLAKSLVHNALDASFDAALSAEAMTEEISTRSEDFKEGLRAMRERRPPEFRGR